MKPKQFKLDHKQVGHIEVTTYKYVPREVHQATLPVKNPFKTILQVIFSRSINITWEVSQEASDKRLRISGKRIDGIFSQ